jgi:hypothetical protein
MESFRKELANALSQQIKKPVKKNTVILYRDKEESSGKQRQQQHDADTFGLLIPFDRLKQEDSSE